MSEPEYRLVITRRGRFRYNWVLYRGSYEVDANWACLTRWGAKWGAHRAVCRDQQKHPRDETFVLQDGKWKQ